MDNVKMSTLSTFAQWLSKSPKWADLKTWLTEKEPNVEILEFEGEPFVILKTKREENPDVAIAEDSVSEAAQVCRSVVWDTRTNLPVSVAPFAARRDQKIPMDDPLRLEDFVEGVMVNVFWVQGEEKPRVSTRSRLNADGTFYSERTFRDLFEEALTEKGISMEDIERVMGAPKKDTHATFLSLVLAHPEHRVVRAVQTANIWAIHAGEVLKDGSVNFSTAGLPVAWRPKVYSTTFAPKAWGDLKTKFEEIKDTKPWYWQGLVVHQGLQRWRFRNGDHDRVRRELRGTESDSFYRFLRLRGQRKVQEYLRVYQEDSADFKTFEGDYRDGTRALYRWYCKCHKEHSVKFKDLPKSVQPLVFGLHKYYLDTLRPEKKTLHIAETIEWVQNNLKEKFGVPNMARMIRDDAAFPPVEPRGTAGSSEQASVADAAEEGAAAAAEESA